MKKIYFFGLILLLFSAADIFPQEAKLIPYRDGNLCGYSDRGLNIRVKPRYDACENMINGMASVMKNGKYGFIDSSGREVIPAKYSYSSNFQDDGAIVKISDRYGVINRKGEAVIPFSDYYISFYSHGTAVVSKDYIYGLMDRSGKLLLPVKFSKLDPVENYLFIAAEKSKTNSLFVGKNYLYNSKGESVVNDGFDLIYPAANGYLMIKSGEKWGYMNSSGAVIAPAIYDSIRNIKRDGTAAFRVKGKWGILDGKGKVLIKPIYDSIGEGDGTLYEEMQADENWFLVRSGDRYGLLSTTGEVIARTDYAMIGSGKSGYFPAFKEIGKEANLPVNGLTLLDSKGWELFTPKKEYNYMGEEVEGLLPAGRFAGYGRGKIMGYINHQGEAVISMQYEEAGKFSGGYAIVKSNGFYGVIDKKGKEVEQFIYDDISRSASYPGLFEGSLAGKKVYFEPGGNHYWK